MSAAKSKPSSPIDKMQAVHAIGTVFSPSAPIDRRDLFAGRINQMQDVLLALHQKGQHVILYGERGVGKTSLANILHLVIGSQGAGGDFDQSGWSTLGCATINCDESDDFGSIWRKVFRELTVNVKRHGFGFGAEDRSDELDLSGLLPEGDLSPDDIRFALAQLPRPATIIIDEIDTVPNKRTMTLLAHTIKNLSDHALKTKLILVGVADSVDELIDEHKSVERSLVQVRMPRMSQEELFEILEKALGKLPLTAGAETKRLIAQLSQGLPHYTHLLGQHAAIVAVNSDRRSVERQDVYAATIKAVDKSPQSILNSYLKATSSARRDSIHAKVLLACALSKTDEMGMFSSSDVKDPLFQLTTKKYKLSSFQRHLDDFCAEARGPILKKTGPMRRYRYRFINPMMPPFVVMQGIKQKLLDGTNLDRYVLNEFSTRAEVQTEAPGVPRRAGQPS